MHGILNYTSESWQPCGNLWTTQRLNALKGFASSTCIYSYCYVLNCVSKQHLNIKFSPNLFLCLFFFTCPKDLFIWRRVVPGRRVSLHTEPLRARELFIRFFINICELFTWETAKLARGGRVTLGGGSLALKVGWPWGASQLFSI